MSQTRIELKLACLNYTYVSLRPLVLYIFFSIIEPRQKENFIYYISNLLSYSDAFYHYLYKVL
jgi:hypothetical protein